MRLRDATQADVEAIALLHWRGWEDAYRGVLTDALLDGATLAMCEAQWPGWFATKSAGLIVAQDAGELVGFVCAVAAREIAALGAASEIQLLYVRADRQGAGLGAALLRAGAAALWPGTMGLWVVRDHARARGFYQRMGGRLGPERRGGVGGGPPGEGGRLLGGGLSLGRARRVGRLRGNGTGGLTVAALHASRLAPRSRATMRARPPGPRQAPIRRRFVPDFGPIQTKVGEGGAGALIFR